ncbi:MAG: hypothetical protein IT538_13075 [Variibacter sp.]|nr:hypothetical protein [Variibacter sp.]
MASQGLPVERLRLYLEELQPEARTLLLRMIERGQLGPTGIPGAELIVEALRPSLRQSAVLPERVGNPQRLFFRPLEPFLVDTAPEHELPGRLDRASLVPLWQWIGRDLLPAEVAAYTQEASAALLAGDVATAERLASGFQDAVAAGISKAMLATRGDERALRRLIGQIGLVHGLTDLHLLHTVLQHREALARFGAKIPGSISNLGEEQAANILTLIRQATATTPDLLQPLLVMVMNRLGAPWQLLRLAMRAAETDVAARIVPTPMALAVRLVFAQMRSAFQTLRVDVRRGQFAAAGALCRQLHDGIRGLRTEMNLSGDNPWSRELAALRADVSALLKAEIEATPGAVRRLLRVRPAKEILPGTVLDAGEVAEAELRIEFTCACRNYAAELAVNQIAPPAVSELQAYFDSSMPLLLEALKGAGPADRKFRQSQVEAAVRLAGKLFGAEYAGLLTRAVGAAVERKPAKA